MLLPAGLTLALLTAGCNTARGMGEDVQAVGSAMSSGAEKTEEKMEEATEEATK
jgi:predicted small secreted protein